MLKTILYFHGFASSSDSDKAKIIKSHISKISKKIKIDISKKYTLDQAKNAHEDLEARKLIGPAVIIPN